MSLFLTNSRPVSCHNRSWFLFIQVISPLLLLEMNSFKSCRTFKSPSIGCFPQNRINFSTFRRKRVADFRSQETGGAENRYHSQTLLLRNPGTEILGINRAETLVMFLIQEFTTTSQAPQHRQVLKGEQQRFLIDHRLLMGLPSRC